MRRHWIFLGAALVAVPALGVPLMMLRAGTHDPQASMAKGLDALQKGDPRTARVELMNAIKARPDWADARIAQARVLIDLGDGVGAEAELRRARALGSAPGKTRHLMANAYLLQGEADEAIAEAQAPDAMPAQRGYALRIIGRARLAKGQTVAAEQALSQAVALSPRDPAAWNDVARLRIASGDQASAIQASEKAVSLAPRNVEAVTLRAMLIRDQYGLKAALPWFDRALALDANHVPALTEYAATLSDIGEARRALAMTRRVIALEPHNGRAFALQALMAARAGRYDLARAMLNRAGGNGGASALLVSGIVYLKGGNPALAQGAFVKLLTDQPDNAQARLLLGRALFDQGNFAEAAGALAPLIDRGEAGSYAFTLAARAQEALGNRAVADMLLARAAAPGQTAIGALATGGDMAALAEAASTHPDAAPAVIPYVRALLSTGQAGAAVSRATALRNANMGAPAAHVILGDALLAAGQPDKAARAYEQAADLRFSEDVALRLVSAWRRAGQPERAAQILSLYLSQNPGSFEATRIAASAWLSVHNWDRAIALLEPLSARAGNNDALLMADLAWAWLGKGGNVGKARALAYAAKAYRLQPLNPVAADVYGWTMLQAGQKQRAVDVLEKALALAPGHPMLKGHLDRAYAAVGDKAKLAAI
jgi:tetratricopeptide (TPR) repeat protein